MFFYVSECRKLTRRVLDSMKITFFTLPPCLNKLNPIVENTSSNVLNQIVSFYVLIPNKFRFYSNTKIKINNVRVFQVKKGFFSQFYS